MNEIVRFRGLEKKQLAKLSRYIVEMLRRNMTEQKLKWPLSKRILALLDEDEEAVAAIVIATVSHTITNFDRIPTMKFEGKVQKGKIKVNTITEIMKELSYIS